MAVTQRHHESVVRSDVCIEEDRGNEGTGSLVTEVIKQMGLGQGQRSACGLLEQHCSRERGEMQHDV